MYTARGDEIDPPAEDSAARGTMAVLVGAALLYVVPSVFLLRTYLQPAFDLAIYDQTLWLILHGESFNTIIASHIFGIHFSPILILLSPLSLIPGGSYPELVFQGLLIASGVFPAARLARAMGRNQNWFVLVYALHPAIIGGSWYGFRPWNIAVPTFMWAVYWIWRQPRPWVVVAAGLLLLSFREDLAVWVGLATLTLAMSGRYRWRDIWVPGAVLAGASAIVLLGVLPSLSPVESYFFGSASDTSASSLTTLGASLLVRIAFLIIPLAVAPAKVRWLLATPLLVPFGGLLIRGGNGLSTFFHYDMMFVPLLILVVALSPETDLKPRLVLVASAVILLTLGVLRPFEPRHGPNPWRYDAQATRVLDEALGEVLSLPDSLETSLSAPSRILPHLSERSNAFIFPSPFDPHDQDNSGYAHVETVTFDCPQPNIVISEHRTDAPVWSATSDGYMRTSAQGPVEVWAGESDTPDEHCSAVWVPSQPEEGR